MSAQVRGLAGLTNDANEHLFAGGALQRVKRRTFIVDAADRIFLRQAPVAIGVADVGDVLMAAFSMDLYPLSGWETELAGYTRFKAWNEHTEAEQIELFDMATNFDSRSASNLDAFIACRERFIKGFATKLPEEYAETMRRVRAQSREAVGALWNIVEGYGDRYVVPTRSLLDDLAADFGHMEAGEELRAAREQSRRLVEMKLAAACNYTEADRRDRANRFVVDAFNGRVDAILSRTKHNNYGTLQQELRDAFSTVNLNGLVFHDARILAEYLDARMAELKWASVVQELKRKEREEQRELQEQIREEEKARREYQRALQDAAREEALIRQAMEQARVEAENASAAERSKLEGKLTELNQRLVEAEAKGQRALSMAQQTRSGNVYIISNVGSFGENVFKIGMTRRLIPEDRIRELGGASVRLGEDPRQGALCCG